MRYLLSNRKFKDLTKLTVAVALRATRLTSHLKMKQAILDTLYPYPTVLQSFKDITLKNINPLVESLIDRNIDNGHKIVIATAAPDFYVKEICKGLAYIATEYTPGEAINECRGKEKLRMVKEWMNDNNCFLNTVVTDHYDDAALFEANRNGINILVNPSKKTLRFFRQLKPAHFLLIENVDDLSVTR